LQYDHRANNILTQILKPEDVLGVAKVGWRQRIGRFLSSFLEVLVLSNLILIYNLTLGQAFRVVKNGLLAAINIIDISAAIKRTIDIIGATIGLILSIPIWIIIPVAIAIDSRGPVFYRQERVGLNRRKRDRRYINIGDIERRSMTERRQRLGLGRNFIIVKFRSMHVDAEKATGPVWATRNDNRVTRVGRILRATRLDEIPQLINVLIGDMSLVGPRPERPFFVNKLNDKIEGYSSRFQFKPGITGLAQVEHKYDESVEDVAKKVTYDLHYIRNWSILQDIGIILKTIVVVFAIRGM
jgi:lipopolysaccharide/colanic/teichoic acid biosynthesis glycosyltransferase